MSFVDKIASQFRQPQGLLGKLVGFAMNFGNRPGYQWTMELLNIQPQDRVLEIGFGPGMGLQMAARFATNGQIVGIDFSETMLREAEKRNRTSVAAGRMRLICGDFFSTPLGPDQFDKGIAINTVYFWHEPEDAFRRIYTTMKAGSKVAITFMEPKSLHRMKWTRTDTFIAHQPDAITEALRAAGFSKVSLNRKCLRNLTYICSLAEK